VLLPALPPFPTRRSSDLAQSRHEETRAIMIRNGSQSLGEGPARTWEEGRFGAPVLRDSLIDGGALCETLETATDWSNVPRLKKAVGKALSTSLVEDGSPALIMCHISHVYPEGCSLYFTVVGEAGDNPQQRWRKAKRDRKSTRLNSSHASISYAVFCLREETNPRRHSG